MSPSSSVCYDCFKNGNHEGHDFLFEKSVYGGCCDCGNPDVINFVFFFFKLESNHYFFYPFRLGKAQGFAFIILVL